MAAGARVRWIQVLVLAAFAWRAPGDSAAAGRGVDGAEPPRVTRITPRGFTVLFETDLPMPSKLLLRESLFPLKTPENFVKGRWGASRELVVDPSPRMRHEMTVDVLKPATRYYYRVPEPGRTNEPAGWSSEYAVNTRAGRGRTECIRVRVKVLLAANVLNGEGLDKAVARPEPMPPEDRRLYAQAFQEAALFFWMNSRMKYWVDFELHADERFYRRETHADAPDWYNELPAFDKEASWRHVLKAKNESDGLYDGEVICEAERAWKPRARKWEYAGSGGGTYGLDRWPVPGSSFFLGGSDVCWLTCHEFKHQIESQYHLSGLTREDDRMWFCHYAARHASSDDGQAWTWDTAADHGEHYGGLAWQMRHMTDEQYLRNAFGELVALADRDGDGLPDDDPRLPMDEKRLGSNPAMRDTDGDGLDDMGEVLASVWVSATPRVPLRQRVRVPYIRPGFNKTDADGDGIPDHLDPYPLYPWKNRIPRGTIQVDGRADDWRDYQRIEFRRAGLGVKKEAVALEIRACYDDDWLYYAFLSRAPHGGIELNTDNDADGYYIGNDNVIVRLKPNGALESVRVHAGARNRWPYEADDMLFESNLQHAARSEAGTGQVVELALPKRPDLGLDLEPGEEVGLAVMVRLPGLKSWVSVFEPGVIFDSVLEGEPAASRPPEPRLAAMATPGSLRTLVDWDSLAVFPRGWKVGMFSSTDPTGQGRDCGNFLRIEGDRYVLAEMAGPGVLTRLWSANPQGQLRIELDGRPAVDGLFKDLYMDGYPPFCSPIAAPSSGGFYSYWPIGFTTSCKVTVGDAPGLAERRAALRVARPVRVPLRGVKELKLIVTDGGDGIGADHADWADAKLIAPGGKIVYLSDLTDRTPGAALVSSGQGWGMLPNGRPGPDGALGRDVSCEGKPLSINGKRYRKGLGSHSPAQHAFALRSPFEWFEAEVGIDDSKLDDQKDGYNPSATFEVYTDGQKVFDSGIVGAPKLDGGFDPNMFFYQINYLQLPPGTDVEPFCRDMSAEEQKALADVLRVWRMPAWPLPVAETDRIAKGALLMPPFGTGDLVQLPGAGQVTSLRLKVRSADRHILRRAVLKIFYDGQDRPAVWCPVGDFFGCGMGEGEYQTLFLGTEAAGWFYSRFPMPFARGVRMALENGCASQAELEFEVRYREADPAAVPEGRFCAHWHEEAGSDRLHPAVRLAGRGNFAGLGLTAVGYGENLGYLEGNEQLIADGDTARALTGTGMEDFFNSGWYYEQGLVDRPLHALLVKSEDKRFGTAAGITSQIRFLLPDRVPFEKSFSATLQHGVNNAFTAVRYATVAYWYQAPPLPGETDRPPTRSLTLPRRMLVRPSDPPDRGAEGNNAAGVAPLAGAVFAEDLRVKTTRGKSELVFWRDISDDYEGTRQALYYGWPNSKLIDNESEPKSHRGDALLCRATVPGSQVGIALKPLNEPVEEALLTLVLVEGPEFGEVEYSLGSQVLGRHDAYHPFVRPSPILTARVRVPPSGSMAPLVLNTVGRNAAARHCDLGVYCVKFAAER